MKGTELYLKSVLSIVEPEISLATLNQLPFMQGSEINKDLVLSTDTDRVREGVDKSPR